MSTEAALLNLSTTISGLQSQIEELKQDKRDLRSDKECLKNELLGLKEELGNALAEASRLRNELQGTNVALEYWKSQSELERSAQEAQDQVSHQSTAVQIMVRGTRSVFFDALGNFVRQPDPTSQTVCESGSSIVDGSPPTAQDIPFTASTTVAASPDEPLLPEPVANTSP
jgi:outer membrane murein-binding lipoprotein Lpp